MKQFRILVVGCGWIAKDWFEYLMRREDSEVVGLVDFHPEAAEKVKATYHLDCPVFTDLDQALAAVHPNLTVDLTYVTTHREVLDKIFDAGSDCLGEKPMCMTLEEASHMVTRARKEGRFYAVMQNRRYIKGMASMKQAIDEGLIGKVTMVSADIFVGADTRGIRDKLEKPMLMDNAIHTFDQVRFLLGADALTCVCESFHPAESPYKNGDAAGSCIFRMSDGSVFCYQSLLGTVGFRTSWDSQWRIIGTKGTIIWNGDETIPEYEVVEYIGEKKVYVRRQIPTPSLDETRHAGCIREMMDALAAGRKSQTDCADNFKSVAMSFAAQQSAATGARVNVVNEP